MAKIFIGNFCISLSSILMNHWIINFINFDFLDLVQDLHEDIGLDLVHLAMVTMEAVVDAGM